MPAINAKMRPARLPKGARSGSGPKRPGGRQTAFMPDGAGNIPYRWLEWGIGELCLLQDRPEKQPGAPTDKGCEYSVFQLFPQDLVDHLRVGLAAGLAHHLTDEKSQQLGLAAAKGRHLLGMSVQDPAHGGLDGC